MGFFAQTAKYVLLRIFGGLGQKPLFPEQSITLFDATLTIFASRLNLPVWTYDHHFDAMQASVWR